ncbi:uncharacterized protein LOC122389498 [Amphibalanus amphitrite]|uniref:uncharacterized protein LOC122389498 n=1 Tax=Amphibalanus amphitrite TaxID=1232801 RepID=UPI001C8FEB0F|nr:uncharacterized protein LOC122389498 [Amphibalanus amphitrite]
MRTKSLVVVVSAVVLTLAVVVVFLGERADVSWCQVPSQDYRELSSEHSKTNIKLWYRSRVDMEFLVKYEEWTKVVKVNPETCDDLKAAMLRRFKIPDDVPVVMQIFLQKYNGYVDVEPGTEVFDGAKLLLKRTSPAAAVTSLTSDVSASCSTVDVDALSICDITGGWTSPKMDANEVAEEKDIRAEDRPTETHEPPATPRHETQGTPRHETHGTPRHEIQGTPRHETQETPRHETQGTPRHEIQGTPRHETQATPRHEIQGTPRHDESPSGLKVGRSGSSSSQREEALKRLPFTVKSLSTGLRSKLEMEVELAETDWKELTNAIFVGYTGKAKSYYPGKSGYDILASDISDAFPYLCGALSGIDARAFIKSKISNKFANKRRYTTDGAVQKMKKAKHEKESNEGLPAYMPPAPVDDLGQRRMANELLEATSERKVELLRSTFAFRRNYLVKGRNTMARYAERYPAAMTLDAMWLDLALMEGKEADPAQLQEEAAGRLRGILAKFKAVTNSEQNEDGLVQELLEELDGADITAPSSAPFIETKEDGPMLVVEGIGIHLTTSKVEQALAWALAFPALQQKLPAGGCGGRALRYASAFLYRYVLGISGGPQLPNRLLRKVQALLK